MAHRLRAGWARTTLLPGTFGWAKVFGTSNYDAEGVAVATDRSGNVVFTGWFEGSVDFGGGILRAFGNGFQDCAENIVLAKYDPNGKHLWSKALGAPGHCTGPAALALDEDDNIYLSGASSGQVDFGRGPEPASLFLAKFSPDGDYLASWSRLCGGWASAMAIDRDENLLEVGTFVQACDFGTGTLNAASSSPTLGTDPPAVFLVKHASDGTVLWSKAFGAPSGSAHGRGIAVDAAGNIAIVGQIYGETSLGGATFALGPRKYAAFIAMFAPDGSHLWSAVPTAPTAYGDAQAVAVAGDNTVVLTGYFGGGSFSFAGKTITGPNLPDRETLVLAYSSSGQEIWAKGFSDKGLGQAITVDPSGDPLVAGASAARLSVTDGSPVWMRDFYTRTRDSYTGLYSGAAISRSMTVLPNTSQLVLTGLFRGDVDFGYGIESAASGGGQKAFLLKLTP